MIGQTLGHYRIVEKIGAGGMGEVYRARDQRLERDVALKVLPPGTLSDEAARKRFRKEALTLSKLNHPHIATVHDFDTQDGVDFLVMEHIPGVTLAEKLATGPLPEQEVARVGALISAALEEAHEQGVVHRDLKPGNIKLTPKGHVKVLDFGLAKLLRPFGETTTTESFTETQALAGTLPYMAPEQLRGQAADTRCDVWALGVVLYEAVTGERPFRGQTSAELSSAILRERPAPLTPQTSMGLRAVIERCLEKEPGQRYQRAGEVRSALEAVQSGAVVFPWVGWKYLLTRRQWVALAGALAALAAVLIGLNVAGVRDWVVGLGGPGRIESVAVLPLENLSGDPEQDYFAAGMHEALITDLAKLGGFNRVIARSSVMRYQETDKPLPQIAQELNVEAVITGSVLRAGDRVRVTAQLIKAATEENLWADRYERELRDVLSLQNEIVGAIAREIKLQLTPQEQARLASARPVNPESYEAYLKGRFYLNKYTPEGFQKGLAYLQQAIEKDPTNPLPYAGLALGYSLIGHEAMPDKFSQAKAAAVKALELDETLAEAHEAMAEIKFYWDWDWAGAERGFQRALELNPNLPEAHSHYGWYLNLFGRIDEGLAEQRRATELDPLTPVWTAWLGWQYWDAGREREAIEEARKSLELNPDDPWGHLLLGLVYGEKGKYEEAIAAHQKAAAISPVWRWALAYTYALAGRRDEALQIAAELKKKPTPMDAFGLAEIHAALKEKDEAFRWLEAAVERRFSWMPWMRLKDIGLWRPSFEHWRDDPRFQDLLRRMNLPQ